MAREPLPATPLGDDPLAEQAMLDETRVPSRWGVVFARFRRHRLAMSGLIVLALLFVMAFVGPHLSRWGYTERDFGAFLQGPSSEHWFGTTQTGGDVFTLTMRGMQKSLVIGMLVAVFATALAAFVGAFAGYYRGSLDRVLMWIVDLMLVIPAFLIVAILSPTFRGKSWILLVLVLAAFMWMITARIVRGMTISLRDREYVLAARYMGVPDRKIITRHILPNVSSLLIVDATINVTAAIIAETGLSYFGFGVQPPDVSLGSLIADGTKSATTYAWLFGFPAGMLVLIVLSVNVIGDGLRDALDPTSKGSL
jgi:peptide/nickel transport system permease protein